MITIHKVRNEEAFIWMLQAARFLNRNIGDVVFGVVIVYLVQVVVNVLPYAGVIIAPLASVVLSYGTFRYLRQIEHAEQPAIKTLFIALQERDGFVKLIGLLLVGLAFLAISWALVGILLAAVLMLQGGYSFSNIPTAENLKAFALDHYVETPLIIVVSLLPFLFFYGSFSYAIPLMAIQKAKLKDALVASLKGNIVNWVPLTAFWLFWSVFAIMVFAILAAFAILGGPMIKLMMGIVGIGIAIAGTLYALPLLQVILYSTYLGIFEGRAIKPGFPVKAKDSSEVSAQH